MTSSTNTGTEGNLADGSANYRFSRLEVIVQGEITTKEELQRYFQIEPDQRLYAKCLVAYWEKKSGDGQWEQLVSEHFRTNHTTVGTATVQRAMATAQRRHEERNIEISTTLTSSGMARVVRYVNAEIIEWHAQNFRAFRNFFIPIDQTMIKVDSRRGQGRDAAVVSINAKVILGIDEMGLVSHYHADAAHIVGAGERAIYEVVKEGDKSEIKRVTHWRKV